MSHRTECCRIIDKQALSMPTKLDPIDAAIFLDVSVSTRRRIEAADMRARQTEAKDFLSEIFSDGAQGRVSEGHSADRLGRRHPSRSRNRLESPDRETAPQTCGGRSLAPTERLGRRSSQRRFHPSVCRSESGRRSSAQPNHSGRSLRSLDKALSETGTDRGGERTFDWGKSSGVDAPRKKITFFSPPAFRGFRGVRGCAPGFPFFFSPPGSDWDVSLPLSQIRH
jgi:hypothetical protein